MAMNLNEFRHRYIEDGEHPVTEITLTPDGQERSHFVIMHYGKYTMIINPLALFDHLTVDCRAFVDGERATASAFGMTEGQRTGLEDIGTTSYGWPSAELIAVLLGEQGKA